MPACLPAIQPEYDERAYAANLCLPERFAMERCEHPMLLTLICSSSCDS
jgi:hypothetical protein